MYRENAYAGITADATRFTVHENARDTQTLDNAYGDRFFLGII